MTCDRYHLVFLGTKHPFFCVVLSFGLLLEAAAYLILHAFDCSDSFM
jgi:hypothetical protein